MHAPPLRLRIAASTLLASALLLAHGAAIACALLFLPGWWVPALVASGIAASLIVHMRRDALILSGNSVTDIVLKDAARCELALRNGNMQSGSVQGSTFVSPLLIVINFNPEPRGPGRAVILMPDSAPAEDLRRVRVWLRYCARADAGASGTS